jgi:hypothetical protein
MIFSNIGLFAILQVKTQLKSSKSYPNDFSQEDGDNSSSGVSSDQDTQTEPKNVGESPAPSPPKSAQQSGKGQQNK